MRYSECRYIKDNGLDIDRGILKHLPLTESTCYILLALAEPRHGYGVMQKIEEMSEGTVKVGPGTLYGAFVALERDGLIVRTGEEDRRKFYVLTETGRAVLSEHIRRSSILVRRGAAVTGSCLARR
jgi:DNA-binding PadR family transcriptional regulator